MSMIPAVSGNHSTTTTERLQVLLVLLACFLRWFLFRYFATVKVWGFIWVFNEVFLGSLPGYFKIFAGLLLDVWWVVGPFNKLVFSFKKVIWVFFSQGCSNAFMLFLVAYDTYFWISFALAQPRLIFPWHPKSAVVAHTQVMTSLQVLCIGPLLTDASQKPGYTMSYVYFHWESQVVSKRDEGPRVSSNTERQIYTYCDEVGVVHVLFFLSTYFYPRWQQKLAETVVQLYRYDKDLCSSSTHEHSKTESMLQEKNTANT